MKIRKDNESIQNSFKDASRFFAMLGVSAKEAAINLKAFLERRNKLFCKEKTSK